MEITLEQQLANLVAHLNTYRKKRSLFLNSDQVKIAAEYYQISEEKLRTLLKST